MKDALERILDELKNDKITPEAEYNALREEKIFRYGYSNSVNTTLLTITLAVFSVGALMFTMSNNTFAKLAEIFFPLFFLLPCLFARICFRSLLKNSVRIGLLSEYMREYLKFEKDSSWEKIKKNHKINYFMDEKKYIGGAKEVPLCVTIVSIFFSSIIGYYPIHDLMNNYWISAIIFFLSLGIVVLLFVIYQKMNLKRIVNGIITISCCIIVGVIVYIACVVLNQECQVLLLLRLAIYLFPMMGVVFIVPNFNGEVDQAEKYLSDYKELISKERNMGNSI